MDQQVKFLKEEIVKLRTITESIGKPIINGYVPETGTNVNDYVSEILRLDNVISQVNLGRICPACITVRSGIVTNIDNVIRFECGKSIPGHILRSKEASHLVYHGKEVEDNRGPEDNDEEYEKLKRLRRHIQ